MCGPRSGSRARNRVRHPRMTSRGSAGRGAVRGGSRHAGRAGATARCRGGSPARSGGWRGCGEPTAWWPALPARRCPGPGPPAGSSRPARYFPDDPASAPPRPAAAGRGGSRWRTGLPGRIPGRQRRLRVVRRVRPHGAGAPQGWCRLPARGLDQQGGIVLHQGPHSQVIAEIQIQIQVHELHPSPRQRHRPAGIPAGKGVI